MKISLREGVRSRTHPFTENPSDHPVSSNAQFVSAQSIRGEIAGAGDVLLDVSLHNSPYQSREGKSRQTFKDVVQLAP
jgi:hypothetical protein